MPDTTDFNSILKTLKENVLCDIDGSFEWTDVIALLVIKLRNTDSLNKVREESNATQIQLTSEKDAGDGKRKTEDFFPSLTLNSTFKSWRISIPVRISNKNIAQLKEMDTANVNGWLSDSIQIRRRLLNQDASGSGNPAIHICYGNDIMPLRKLLNVDDYLVIAKRKDEALYEVFGVRKDIDLGKGKQMFISDKVVQDSTAFSLSSITSFGEKRENFSPEWFEAKASEFPTLDQEAQDYLKRFFDRFSIDRLAALSGKDILNEIFLNNNNKSNLCCVLEFDSECRRIFGGIKSGTAYKYGLHYSKKNGSWATGSGKKPVFISEDEAIDLGTQIRDALVAGAELIAKNQELETEDDYLKLYKDLVDATDGYVNRVWFQKYYAMMFPKLFPTFYSPNAQMNVINKLNLVERDNPISRLGEIAGFVKKCNISNVMFGRIFGTYCYSDDISVEELETDGEGMKNCLEIIRPARTKREFPLNAIIYGAPGTGKTYSTAEYALAIIEHREVDLSFKTPEERKKVMESYNGYIRSGQVVFTTFHQNYGYEEFVQGLRPDVQSEEMSFKVVDGVFKRIADKALNETDPSKNYVIIIDEINRANISKVLGELITLIEEDKRWGEVNQTCVTLQSGDLFAVPNNLYILGTMNSADKSISLIDAALRRRFEFIEQKPIPELVDDSELRKVFKKLNDTLAEELQSSDLLIGHSYFMGKTIKELPKIMNNSIVPLLYEYFYDNKKKVMSVLSDVLKDTGYEPVDEVLGRVSVKKKEQ